MKNQIKIITKTFTYLILDMLTHSVIVYIAANLYGYKISVISAGVVGVVIEIVETIMYYLHEIIWSKVSLERK